MIADRVFYRGFKAAVVLALFLFCLAAQLVAQDAAPAIQSISPNNVPVGQTISVVGSGFGSSPGTLTVGGVAVTPAWWSDSSLGFVVPATVTTGANNVVVTSAVGSSSPATLNVQFNPVLASVSPNHGLPSSQVVINGTGFGANTAGTVSFNSVPATILSWSDTQIVVTAPNGSAGGGPVMVSWQGVNSNTVPFNYAPTLSYLANSTVGLNWGSFSIVGQNFLTTPGTVTLNGVALSIYSWSGNSISLPVPQNNCTGPIVVTTAYGSTSPATLTIQGTTAGCTSSSALTLTGLSPSSGTVGTQVTLSGSGFGATQGASQVLFNGAAATASSWSDSSITALVPTEATSGPVTVTVGSQTSSSVQFTVTVPAVVSSVSPTSGTVGASVTVTGSNFGSTQGSNTITFNGVSATVTSWSDTQIIATVPKAATTGAVVVTTSGTASNSNISFTVIPTPTIVSLTPSTGVIGSSVTLTGSGFGATQGSSQVSFNGVAATASSWSDTGITVTVPTGATSGAVTVTVGTLTSSGVSFTVAVPSVVSSVSPTSAIAGTAVTIIGSGFGSTQGSSTATFNGVAATVSSWSDTQIVATVPRSASTGAVVVTTNGAASNATVLFTVIPSPTITSLSPTSGKPGTVVTITGNTFGATQDSGTVTFNGLIVDVTTWSDTSITASLPTGATSGPVIVTAGGVSSNSVQFTVITPATILSLTPTNGPIGTSVTVTGTGFGATQGSSTISFNSVAATVSSWSDTQLVVVVPNGATSGSLVISINGTNYPSSESFTVTASASSSTNTVTLSNSLGYQSTYSNAVYGGVLVVSDSNGAGCGSCTLRGIHHYAFDVSGNMISDTDALANTRSYTYDGNSSVTSTSAPVDSSTMATTSYTYNSLGEVLTATDPLGNVTTNTYDANGNLISVTSPSPDGSTATSVTQFAYDSMGELIQVTDPLGRINKMGYTSAGLLQSITDAQQNVTTYGYDARGNRTSVVDAAGNTTTFAFDLGNRLISITYPDKTTASFGYDYRGRRTSATDQDGNTTSYAYDDADRLISVTDAKSNVTKYSYDTENNLLSITDARGNATAFAYDAHGWVIQTTFPSTLTESYVYDAIGNLTSKTDRKGQTIGYLYDALNRLTQKNYPDSTSVNYIYDLVGKVLNVNDPTGSYGFAYDNMGRLTGTTTSYAALSGQTFSNTYSYDAASNRIGLTAADGSSNNYQYDTLNRLTGLNNSWAGQFGFSYDTLGRRIQLKRPNSVNSTYNYDSLSRLLSVLHGSSDGASYGYDSAGNRTSKQNIMTGAAENYGYDALYELTSVTQSSKTIQSFSYDAVGNRLSSLGLTPYSYNISNQLLSLPSTAYTYDSNGNMLTKATTSGTTTYAWDMENRLSSVSVPQDDGSTSTVTFKYDPFGRRILKSSSSGTTIYAYDGANVIAEYSSVGAVVASYTQGAGIDEPLAMQRSGSTAYYNADGLGSITSLTGSGGATVSSYVYHSFGKTKATEGIFNPYRYTAREQDPETGLYYYRARYYDPTIGRFISEDPIGFIGGGNFYRYSLNDPINLRDPMGLNPGTIAIPIEECFASGVCPTVIAGCFASGVCETVIIVGAGTAAVGAVGYYGYNYFSKRNKQSDPIARPADTTPGSCKNGGGKCNPCPPDTGYWEQAGNAHGSTTGSHFHWYTWDQAPYPDCTCRPHRQSGPTAPPGVNPL
jgi:RHS repeat-associated protein